MEIIEEADATPEQRAIQEINSGVYAFEAHLLGDVIKRVPPTTPKVRSISPTLSPSFAPRASGLLPLCWKTLTRCWV